MTLIHQGDVDTLADIEANPLDAHAPSENFIGVRDSDDVPIVDLYAMLSEGLRVFDRDGYLKRALATHTSLVARHYQKIWKLAKMTDPRAIPDELVVNLLALVGFGPGQGKASEIAPLLSTKERRSLAAAAVKFWRLRGRLDALEELLTHFTRGIPPALDGWHRRAARVGVVVTGTTGIYGADLTLLATDRTVPLSESDVRVVSIRCPDEGGNINRAAIEAFCSLARIGHDRYEIAYVQFLDRFHDGRLPHWRTAGVAPSYTTALRIGEIDYLPSVVLAAGAMEWAATPLSPEWSNICLTFAAAFPAGGRLAIFFLADGEDEAYRLELEPSLGAAVLYAVVGGVDAEIGSATIAVADATAFGVQIDTELVLGGTFMSISIDGDVEIVALDASHSHGTFGFKVGTGSAAVAISNVELYESPLTVTVLEEA